jgi:hypothetical protein
VSFVFHASQEQGWKAKVRPPRLGGKRQVGVFASRSPHRPNFLGLSLLRLEAVHTTKPVHLEVSGLDLLDGTPVVDIKPYVAYTDAVVDARSGFASDWPAPTQQVIFSDSVLEVLRARPDPAADEQLIRQVLSLDPRPAYKKRRTTERLFGMLLDDYEIKWRVEGDVTTVEKMNFPSRSRGEKPR